MNIDYPQITIRNQPDGWTDFERGDAILCICPRTAEGPLSKYFILKGEAVIFLVLENKILGFVMLAFDHK